jgi:uncharacterized SAM-binding protein YcdF (DUF218 family)
MDFALTKILHLLLLPPASLILLVLAGLILLPRRRTLGRALITGGLVLLYLLSLPSVANVLIRPLEAAYPPYAFPSKKADAVVVLGGGARDLSWVPSPPAPAESSLERLVEGISLARTLRIPLAITGGSGEINPGGVREADAMADTAARLGFPRRDLILENRSRNTWENAEYVKKLLPGRTIVLVTSAYHMRRSAAMFRKQGFTVIPAPAGYKSPLGPVSITSLIPQAGALYTSSTALAEYLSLAWYHATGKL